MSNNIFNGSRTVDSVAYDMALKRAFSSGDRFPEMFLYKIAEQLPGCRAAAQARWEEETNTRSEASVVSDLLHTGQHNNIVSIPVYPQGSEMSKAANKIFTGNRTVDSVAYDMALARGYSSTDYYPEMFIFQIGEQMPGCRTAAQARWQEESGTMTRAAFEPKIAASKKVFTGGRTIDSVAYDMAVVRAWSSSDLHPEMYIYQIGQQLKNCRLAAEERWQQEQQPGF